MKRDLYTEVSARIVAELPFRDCSNQPRREPRPEQFEDQQNNHHHASTTSASIPAAASWGTANSRPGSSPKAAKNRDEPAAGGLTCVR